MSEVQLPTNLDVVIAHCSEETRNTLCNGVGELGHRVRIVCNSNQALLETCLDRAPDLIISGIDLEDGDTVDTLIEISEKDPTPGIIVTPQSSLLNVEEALKDHVMAYLVEPIDEEQLKPTIYLVVERFKQFEELHKEVEVLKDAMAARKVIERAKGILMSSQDIDESEAFRRLQKLSTTKRMKMVAVAEAVITAAELDKL
ncbi:MAG: ANTAR domain-containing protein [Lacipirellulaceae bacterium]